MSFSLRQVRGVILDVDGVLLDARPSYHAVAEEAARRALAPLLGEAQARAERAFRWGAHLPNGARRFAGVCPAEEQAELDAALTSKRKGVHMTCDGDDEDGLPAWHEAEGDQRTTAQVDFDTFMAYFRAGVRAEA